MGFFLYYTINDKYKDGDFFNIRKKAKSYFDVLE